MRTFTCPNEYLGTDSERIRKAVDEAAALGLNRTIISQKAGAPEEPWNITEPILLPSDFHLIVDNCTLRMGDGTFCNMITNKNCRTPEGRTQAGRQRNIVVEGRGNAVLSGGEYNGLCEWNAGKDGWPKIWENNLILFTNVEGVTVRNLRLERQRWWAICFVHCAWGKVTDLHFEADCTSIDENGNRVFGIPDGTSYPNIYLRNADGVDLRMGCHDFLIQNLTGFCEDDFVALTCLNGNIEKEFSLEGGTKEIANVQIQNILGGSVCSQVRLLNKAGTGIRNVQISNITDTWTPEAPFHRAHFTVRVGDVSYGDTQPMPEECRNITIENVYSCAELSAVALCGGMKNVTVRNICPDLMAPDAVLLQQDEADVVNLQY